MAELRATYRLQLGPQLDFRGARELVPYLRDLGISHLYLSPSLQARAGSTHGYDVVDPTSVSEELGGEEELRRLCEAGLGVVLDVVPNHMAASEDENPFWRDPLLRAKFFDLDWRTGVSRRFFDIGELAGVRIEDPEVFEVLSRKVIELVREGLVDGVRIDHPDGLANPAQYFRRLRESGVEHVWIEKILEPGEQLRDWPVEGTTGYEFLNDTTALFVDPAAEEPLTALYEEATGESRSFEELAAEAKLEQARTTFDPEADQLAARLGEASEGLDLPLALASFHVYRTYVDPDTGLVDGLDREAVRAARLPPRLAAILLLEERGHDAFVIRFQQTTPPVMAKGVEDTAFYRYHRLVALNEVGGSPGRFSLPVDEFHAANLERARRFPLHLLASQTHDTKRSGDVRARLVALSWLPDEWAELVRSVEIPAGVHPNDAYLVLQTLVGAWPLTRERLDGYLEKALREGKLRSGWLEPDEAYERRLQDFAWSLREDVEPFARRLAEVGAGIALAQTLLKLTCPGVPDIYQGDEVWSFNLVDPDNRRPVDWAALRAERGHPKQDLIRRVLAERIEGEYEAVDAPDGVCAFVRGRHLVAVPVRPGAAYEPPPGWRPVVPGLYVR
ncbi:MAG TPA: alpha-amylase family glycosyl hydrolase [Gaiellaceae bacterium]|nr:alpha-amylase family glycosyl hydrolase [Gaiellaceae bacterium]